MTDAELLIEIKNRLSITGSYHDELLLALANDAKTFLLNAGVDVTKSGSVGLICRGVADMWNFGAGGGEFSPMFKTMAIQSAVGGC